VKGAASEKRVCPKLVRFTPTELEVVRDRARGSGRPVACYIREAALGGRPKAQTGALNHSVIRDLAGFATKLRELAQLAAERHSPEAPICAGLAGEALDLIRQID